ncbi:MAG TPA: hypothetical protein VH482_36230 [Thermomicrobiales bacterium]|jgi:hypothetical protein
MPTHEEEDAFWRDFDRLSAVQKAEFNAAVAKFVADLRRGSFRKGLRIKRVQGRPDTWEMTWADDGRAFFTYGSPLRPGDPHIVWLRVGTHDIFDE